MERLNIGSKPYNKSSKNVQNRLTHTKPRSQSFANSEQRTANSISAFRAHISSRNTITALTPTAQEISLRAFFYCQMKMYLYVAEPIRDSKGQGGRDESVLQTQICPLSAPSLVGRQRNQSERLNAFTANPSFDQSQNSHKNIGKNTLSVDRSGFQRAKPFGRAGKRGWV